MLKLSMCSRSDLTNSRKKRPTMCKNSIYGLECAEIPGAEEIARGSTITSSLCSSALICLPYIPCQLVLETWDLRSSTAKALQWQNNIQFLSQPHSIQKMFLGHNQDIIKSSQASGEEEVVVGMAITNQFIEDLLLTYATKRTDLEVQLDFPLNRYGTKDIYFCPCLQLEKQHFTQPQLNHSVVAPSEQQTWLNTETTEGFFVISEEA